MDPLGTFPQYPGWEVVSRIGSGSFGSVYEIRRDLFGVTEQAALKHLRIPHDDNEAADMLRMGYSSESVRSHYREYLDKILDEYRLMAEMKGHSNIVHCEDVLCVPRKETIGWDVFIRMELLTPLMLVLSQFNSDKQVVKLARDIGSALCLCRRHSILHRDLKPQNIFISRDGDYKLGDFGIAKIAEATKGGTMIGTYNYMAPEVYANQPYGHQADLYSLGLVLYWLLNDCRLPFYPPAPAVPTSKDLENARLCRFRGDPLPAPRNGDPQLQSIVLKACAYDPADRYRNAEELLRDLDRLSPSEDPWPEASVVWNKVSDHSQCEEERQRTETDPDLQRSIRTLRLLLSAASVALLVLIMVLAASFRKPGPEVSGSAVSLPTEQRESTWTDSQATDKEAELLLEPATVSEQEEKDSKADLLSEETAESKEEALSENEEKAAQPEDSAESAAETSGVSVPQPFFGIWGFAADQPEAAEAEAQRLRNLGLDAQVIHTTDWSNLNPRSYYVITIGVYETKGQADLNLPSVKTYVPDAFVKYSGTWQGG